MKFQILEGKEWKKVSKKVAKEYIEKFRGKGEFEKRLKEAKLYFLNESDTTITFCDGLKIYLDL